MKADNMTLPTTCDIALLMAVDPGLNLLPAAMHTGAARLLILAICKQESGLAHRIQQPNGPAHGLDQFELNGVRDVFHHPVSVPYMQALCDAREIDCTPEAIYAEMVQDDLLSVAMGRLMLLTDPHPLPMVEDEQGAYDYYIRNWRPGAPDRNRWKVSYAQAIAATHY